MEYPHGQSVSHRGSAAPWVVVSHDMAQLLRQTDLTIDSSPWRFIFQIRGMQGLPPDIDQVAVFWKTRHVQAQTRMSVGTSCSSSDSSLPSSSPGVSVFERGCLTIDTSFAADPLAIKGEAIRDKLLVFSIKGYRAAAGGPDDVSEVRIGSFSFRCMQVMSETAIGQCSRVFKIAVDSSGLSRQAQVTVSLRAKCFPLWMAPAFGNEFEESGSEVRCAYEAELKETLAKLSGLSQQYVASRSLLSRGCSDGSVALLDPIFRSPLNLAAQELLFTTPPFPKCVVDSSFSAVMAPALLQESVAVNMCKVLRLRSSLHWHVARKKLESALALMLRNADFAAGCSVQLFFKGWAKLCNHSCQKRRLARCVYFLNRSCQRLQYLHSFKTAFQFWKKLAAWRSCRMRRAFRALFFCFQEWKSLSTTSKIDWIEARKRGSDDELKEALRANQVLEREIVLLKSKIAEASATSVLMRNSRPEHLQQLHVSRAAELSAINRAELAEDLLAAAQRDNEVLKEQMMAQREVVDDESSEKSIFQQLRETEELNERVRGENLHLLEENSRLREKIDVEVSEKNDLAAHVQSLSAALKQQVAMMMKRSVAAVSHRS